MSLPQSHRFCVAPMMDWTDRHCRAFHRSLTKRALLYTEMVTSKAVIHGDRDRLLGFSEVEHPVALQLGGSEPDELAACTKIAEQRGYDEVNLNCGCPSDRVQSGSFGACLMREPELVADCLQAMREAVSIPVTVKCRIGVDEQEPREALFALVEACRGRGITTFVVHARKAWLKGLSPKENREVPPLDYGLVHELKRAFPELVVILNGGLDSLEACAPHLEVLDGVMLGRVAYHDPALLGQVDAQVFGEDTQVGPFEAIAAYRPYVEAQLEKGVHLPAITRHMLGLMARRPGARLFRRLLTTQSIRPGAGVEVLDEAVAAVRQAQADAEIRRLSYQSSGW